MASTTIANFPEFDNVMSPANIRDPFPLYRWLRENSPVHWSKYTNSWLLTRFADVRAAIGEPKRFSSKGGVPLLAKADVLPTDVRDAFNVGYRFCYQNIQTSDAPIHTTQRTLITKAFSGRVVENLRVSIARRIDILIDQMAGKSTCDFVSDFAYPLPALVILDLLGVPEQHYSQLRRSAGAFGRFFLAALAANPAELKETAVIFQETEILLRNLLKERRANPQPDLLSALANVEDGPLRLPDEDIVVLANVLLFAGHETTANLLAGSLLHLLKDRSQWENLRLAGDDLSNPIEELLRFVSPVLSMSRVATEDMQLHDTVIKKGERVSMMIGSANHDEAQFIDADSLVLSRPRAHSVAFGYGIHFCIGAMLARLETELSLKALTARLPEIRLLSADPEYQPIFILRSMKSLSVAIS